MFELTKPQSKGLLYLQASDNLHIDRFTDSMRKKVLSNDLTNDDKRKLFVKTKSRDMVNLLCFEKALSKQGKTYILKQTTQLSKIQVEVYSSVSNPNIPLGRKQFNKILDSSL